MFQSRFCVYGFITCSWSVVLHWAGQKCDCVQRMLWRQYFCPCGCLRIAASSMLEMSNDFTQSLHLTFFSHLESRASQDLLLGLVSQPFSPHSYTKLDDAPMPNSKRKYTNRCYLYLPCLLTVSIETTMITAIKVWFPYAVKLVFLLHHCITQKCSDKLYIWLFIICILCN